MKILYQAKIRIVLQLNIFLPAEFLIIHCSHILKKFRIIRLKSKAMKKFFKKMVEIQFKYFTI